MTSMPAVLDKEIVSSEDDSFGHRHYAKALESLIESDTFCPPFSIGLLGPWGTGKSSIKQLYISSLRDDRSQTESARRHERFHPITFNAWRYGNEDLKRALLRHVFLELGGDETALHRKLVSEVQETLHQRRSWKDWLRSAADQVIAPVLFFMGILVLIAIFVFPALYFLGVTEGWIPSTVIGAFVTLAIFLARQTKLQPVSLYNALTTLQLPSTTAEQYESLLHAQIQEFKRNTKGKRCERLVIFVDDLDRLSAAEMVSGLDAVRMFLEMPERHLPKGLGVIFVISCDEDKVAQALSGQRRGLSQDLLGSVFSRADARRYLDRLFQFRLEIPPFPKRDMREFARGKLKEFGPLERQLIKSDVSVDELIDRLIHVGVQSPRNALQILNAFAQSWWLATERERAGIGSTVAGALHEGAVTRHPLALAALCVLRVDFPDFFGHLQERPDLLAALSGMLFLGRSMDEYPGRVQELLSEFLDPGDSPNRLKTQHRRLRQYSAGLQSLRWPKSIQPLLLLAEDAVTREYGARAPELMDAFVSGDTQGVLDVFGRATDTSPLKSEDVGLLEDLTEAVGQEMESRQINASRVLAELSGRLPRERDRKLMTFLARKLSTSAEARANVRPREGQRILENLDAHDRQGVVAGFVKDFLDPEAQTRFELPTGERPNLDQMAELAREACDLALWVRSQHGLPRDTDTKLLAWLKERAVRTASSSYSLRFSELESWMSGHSGHLLEGLREDYSHLVIAQLEAEDFADFDIGPSLMRVASVFAMLAEGGQQSRKIMWEQLSRLAAVKHGDAVAVAWKEAQKYSGTAGGGEASQFTNELADRINKESTDASNWPLDWEHAAARALLGLATEWSSQLGDDAIKALSQTIVNWGTFDETAAFALRGHELIKTNNPASLSFVYDEWAGEMFNKLARPCKNLLAAEFSIGLSREHQDVITTFLDGAISRPSIEEVLADEYLDLIRSLPISSWAEEPLQAHGTRLFAAVRSNFQNREWIERLFPAARHVLLLSQPGVGAAMLTDVFTKSASVPAVYILLHRLMRDHWPEEKDAFGSYGASRIFEGALDFLSTRHAHPDASSVVRSMQSMLSLGIVDDTGGFLAQAICWVWPTDPSVLEDCLPAALKFFDPARTVELMADAGQLEDDNTQLLDRALSSISQQQDPSSQANTLLQLVSQEAITIAGNPDGALAAWMKALGTARGSAVRQVLSGEIPNDGQAARLLRQSLALREELGINFFIEMLPVLIANSEYEETRQKLFEANEEIMSLAKDGDSRAQVASALADLLPKAPDKTTLTKLAKWIRNYGGTTSVERKTIIEQLDLEDLQILADVFPESKALRRRLKDRTKSNAD